MAYDLQLAERVRLVLSDHPLIEKKMFGGTGFLLNGNMVCGVHGNNLIVRVGAERHVDSLSQPSTKPFDLTGKPMTGWVEVLPDGTKNEEALAIWVRLGLEYAQTLPPKTP